MGKQHLTLALAQTLNEQTAHEFLYPKCPSFYSSLKPRSRQRWPCACENQRAMHETALRDAIVCKSARSDPARGGGRQAEERHPCYRGMLALKVFQRIQVFQGIQKVLANGKLLIWCGEGLQSASKASAGINSASCMT